MPRGWAKTADFSALLGISGRAWVSAMEDLPERHRKKDGRAHIFRSREALLHYADRIRKRYDNRGPLAGTRDEAPDLGDEHDALAVLSAMDSEMLKRKYLEQQILIGRQTEEAKRIANEERRREIVSVEEVWGWFERSAARFREAQRQLQIRFGRDAYEILAAALQEFDRSGEKVRDRKCEE